MAGEIKSLFVIAQMKYDIIVIYLFMLYISAYNELK